jgi:hypothetical protein
LGMIAARMAACPARPTVLPPALKSHFIVSGSPDGHCHGERLALRYEWLRVPGEKPLGPDNRVL